MAFNPKQARALKAKLAYKHVKSRTCSGTPIAYVEGWHVIAEANRIFGFDAWDRTTLAPTCVWSELQRGQTVCFYSTRVRIRVRAGDIVVMRDGIGTGIGRSPSPEQAHEIALKAAETDATKRALATFGNPFGLALYDKEQAHVTKPGAPSRTDAEPRSGAGYTLTVGKSATTYPTPATFVAAALEAVVALAAVDDLYVFWEANVAVLSQLRRDADVRHTDPVAPVIEALKKRARQLGLPPRSVESDPALARPLPAEAPARLAIPKERRVRDKNHLAFVARHPCLICGRQPVHAHHLKFAQPRAMAMKVSDEFTVPLCAIHHDELHRSSDERAWWARHGIIEPLKVAAKLWQASQHGETQPLPIDVPEGTAPEPARMNGADAPPPLS